MENIHFKGTIHFEGVKETNSFKISSKPDASVRDFLTEVEQLSDTVGAEKGKMVSKISLDFVPQDAGVEV